VGSIAGAGSLDYAVERRLARGAGVCGEICGFSWRRRFNIFITSTTFVEGDEQKRAFFAGLDGIGGAELVRAVGFDGIAAPEKM